MSFFRFTTAGESHGRALVAVVEGLPSGVAIDVAEINRELFRRQQGYGRGGRMRIETDVSQVISGVRHGKTLGSPVAMMIDNKDWQNWTDVMSVDAPETAIDNPRIVSRPRPGHADLVGGQKYQTKDLRDVLERASARETAARVACGALAKQFLAAFDVAVVSHVAQLGNIPASPIQVDFAAVKNISNESQLNCVDTASEALMIAAIDEARRNGDTLGGVFEVIVKGLTVGLGSH
ncbi:MAG: chorismate synthase, partial [Pyrinomonadaceae bacterium]|nr:chorismate synthase [Pyrinomonadaceae bacterium]